MIDLRRIDTEIIKSYNLDTKMKRPNSKRFYHCVKTLCPIIYLVCLIANFSCSNTKSEEYFVDNVILSRIISIMIQLNGQLHVEFGAC